MKEGYGDLTTPKENSHLGRRIGNKSGKYLLLNYVRGDEWRGLDGGRKHDERKRVESYTGRIETEPKSRRLKVIIFKRL